MAKKEYAHRNHRMKNMVCYGSACDHQVLPEIRDKSKEAFPHSVGKGMEGKAKSVTHKSVVKGKNNPYLKKSLHEPGEDM
jgi:hypothetical protein